jgi:hypothetical protein
MSAVLQKRFALGIRRKRAGMPATLLTTALQECDRMHFKPGRSKQVDTRVRSRIEGNRRGATMQKLSTNF